MQAELRSIEQYWDTTSREQMFKEDQRGLHELVSVAEFGLLADQADLFLQAGDTNRASEVLACFACEKS